MKKKVASIFVSIALTLSFVGCSGLKNKQAKVGETIETAWFYMNVKSATKMQTYGSYTAGEGKTLVDVVIYLENTFTEPLYFTSDEFAIDDPADKEYVYLPFGPEEVSAEDAALAETVIPYEFTLAINGTVEQHFIYEVSDSSTGLQLRFVEQFEDETVGDIYYVDLGI